MYIYVTSLNGESSETDGVELEKTTQFQLLTDLFLTDSNPPPPSPPDGEASKADE